MNVRRLIITAAIVLLLGTLFTAGFHSLAVAQNKSKTADNKKNVSELPPEMVGKLANELLSRINDSAASVKRYEKKKVDASAEDRLVLQLQIYQLRIRIMDDIHQLADALLELEKAGPQPELREQVEGVFARITPMLWLTSTGFAKKSIKFGRVASRPRRKNALPSKMRLPILPGASIHSTR